ncbi:MAG: serine/threonine protein kinase [Deltaproteobacteria bacterium]|nr:serine/threonine protein kinase [Deltaproteobacteria bacterium]
MTRTLDECRALERSGDSAAAYQHYIDGDFIEDAARLLVGRSRGLDAAELLLAWVARQTPPTGERARACGREAARLFEQHGRGPRALSVLAWLQDSEALTALAVRLGETDHAFEAGCALARHGDPTRAPASLLRVPRGDPRYAAAALETVRALARGAPLTMNIDRWLADFIRRGPGSDAEADAFYGLAGVYAAAGFPENADEVLGRLLVTRPGYRDAAALKEQMLADALGGAAVLARVVAEDSAFAEAAGALGRPPSDALVASSTLERSATEEVGGATPVLDADGGATTVVKNAPLPGSVAAAAASAPAVLAFSPGMLVADRFRVVDVLGKGGMSTVYRVVDVELNESMALKLFTQPVNEEAVERFKQEIRLARQLVHENVIRMYDIGFAAGARFLTMELLVGEDMHAKMVRGLSLRDGALLLAQACAGLDAAHRLGVVHRDVKPENLFVTTDNVLKVMDFGIATHTKNNGLTLAGMVVGTPEYMAPEQAHGHMRVAHSADLYSLGVMLYALATGQLPFRHAELVPLLMMHVQQAPEPPRRLNPACPVEFEQLILELLAKRAEQRPASARVVEDRLKRLVQRGVLG